ncbi:S-layer homology domain-containing protein [Alkalicoccus chagannorensis]|uniref:S-layer homology domain-containing protein n=1 Tax=Alkalicoccus chagannorensis TaxID=427072 RepID=UPI00047979A3|nr:S-layer homology domain-containing protein [Alkalicoccus chagannorensis]
MKDGIVYVYEHRYNHGSLWNESLQHYEDLGWDVEGAVFATEQIYQIELYQGEAEVPKGMFLYNRDYEIIVKSIDSSEGGTFYHQGVSEAEDMHFSSDTLKQATETGAGDDSSNVHHNGFGFKNEDGVLVGKPVWIDGSSLSDVSISTEGSVIYNSEVQVENEPNRLIRDAAEETDTDWVFDVGTEQLVLIEAGDYDGMRLGWSGSLTDAVYITPGRAFEVYADIEDEHHTITARMVKSFEADTTLPFSSSFSSEVERVWEGSNNIELETPYINDAGFQLAQIRDNQQRGMENSNYMKVDESHTIIDADFEAHHLEEEEHLLTYELRLQDGTVTQVGGHPHYLVVPPLEEGTHQIELIDFVFDEVTFSLEDEFTVDAHGGTPPSSDEPEEWWDVELSEGYSYYSDYSGESVMLLISYNDEGSPVEHFDSWMGASLQVDKGRLIDWVEEQEENERTMTLFITTAGIHEESEMVKAHHEIREDIRSEDIREEQSFTFTGDKYETPDDDATYLFELATEDFGWSYDQADSLKTNAPDQTGVTRFRLEEDHVSLLRIDQVSQGFNFLRADDQATNIRFMKGNDSHPVYSVSAMDKTMASASVDNEIYYVRSNMNRSFQVERVERDDRNSIWKYAFWYNGSMNNNRAMFDEWSIDEAEAGGWSPGWSSIIHQVSQGDFELEEVSVNHANAGEEEFMIVSPQAKLERESQVFIPRWSQVRFSEFENLPLGDYMYSFQLPVSADEELVTQGEISFFEPFLSVDQQLDGEVLTDPELVVTGEVKSYYESYYELARIEDGSYDWIEWGDLENGEFELQMTLPEEGDYVLRIEGNQSYQYFFTLDTSSEEEEPTPTPAPVPVTPAPSPAPPPEEEGAPPEEEEETEEEQEPSFEQDEETGNITKRLDDGEDIEVSGEVREQLRGTEGTLLLTSEEGSVRLTQEQLEANEPLYVSISAEEKETSPFEARSPVVTFDLHDGESEGSFSSYVEKTFPVSANVDPEKAAVMKVDEDGIMLYPVPAVFLNGEVTVKSFAGGSFAVIEEESDFLDVAEDSWAAGYVNKLASKQLILGRDDATFDPENSVTRAEFAAMLTRSLGLRGDGLAPPEFPDLEDGAWYEGYVQAALGAGIIQGYEDETFRPDAEISREEAAVMMMRASLYTQHSLDTGSMDTFVDEDDISSWAREAVAYMSRYDLMQGDETGAFQPTDSILRQETAAVLERMLRRSAMMN